MVLCPGGLAVSGVQHVITNWVGVVLHAVNQLQLVRQFDQVVGGATGRALW
jgi:hypothetical protein